MAHLVNLSIVARFVRETGRLLRQFSRDRCGVVAVMTAVSLPVFVGFSALAIDLSYAYLIRNQLQITADSSALAGVSQVQLDEATVKAEAMEFAQLNMATNPHGNVLVANDIIIGHWDPDSRTFTPTGTTGGPGTACFRTRNLWKRTPIVCRSTPS